MRISIIHITLFFLSSSLFSQADILRQDLRASQAAMLEMLPFKVSTEYTLYATHDTLGVMSTAYSETYFTQTSYYQHIEGVHTFIEGNNVAIVDEEEKTIVYDQKELDISNLIFNLDLDNLEDLVQSIDFSENNQKKKYELSLSRFHIYSKIVLEISKRTMLIDRVELFYANSQGLENTLQEVETPRLITQLELISIGKRKPYSLHNNPFYKYDDGNIKTKERCQDYHIINNQIN